MIVEDRCVARRQVAAQCLSCGRAVSDDAPSDVLCGRCSTTGSSGGNAFVGRRRELQTLRSKLDEAFDGKGSLTRLVSEAGIGKSAIALEFASEAGRRCGVVLWGGCLERESALPFGPRIEAPGKYAADVKAAWEFASRIENTPSWGGTTIFSRTIGGMSAVIDEDADEAT